MRLLVWAAAVCAAMVSTGPSSAAVKGAITFSKLAEKLPAGVVWFTRQDGVFCVTHETLKADGVLRQDRVSEFGPIFMREIAAHPDTARDDRPNLFDTSAQSQDGPVYEIGGLIHGMNVKVCTLQYGAMDGGAKGSGDMQIEWQIYSPAKRALVATIETRGHFDVGRGTDRDEVLPQVMQGAFADAVRNLARSPEFQSVLDAPVPKDELKSDPGRQDRIVAPAGRPQPRSVADATGAVVLVRTPDAHGSGVLVSTDGYILTDAHVVELNKAVTIRWSDGFETQGKVVRIHKQRDVALIKSDAHGRSPLPIRKGPVQQGDTVMAIGAPLDMDLQGTVTRGIVSANRIMDGYAFIQSDVAINHGNSGGPLLDDKGYVIGLTDLSWQPAENVQIGINFFTPIGDALDFLSFDLVQAEADKPAAQKTVVSRAGARVSAD